MATSNLVFLAIFFWGMFVVARIFVYAAKIDIRIKKKVWPVIIIALGLTILATAYAFQLPAQGYIILVPITFLIVFINLRGFYFCHKCERMMGHKDIFHKPARCANCKAVLSS